MPKHVEWSMVIYTNRLAAEFADEISAYVTGSSREPAQADAFRAAFYSETAQERLPSLFSTLFEKRLGRRDGGGQARFAAPHDNPNAVRVFLSRKPSREQWSVLVRRALAFPEAWRRLRHEDGFRVTKVRLLKTTEL